MADSRQRVMADVDVAEATPERRRQEDSTIPTPWSPRLVPRSSPVRASGSRGILHLVETEIVPRLMLARNPMPPSPATALVVNPHAVAEFADLVLTQEAQPAAHFVAMERQRGTSVEDLYLGLLAPTALRLGDLWKEDACDFVQVTLGLSRLQRMVHELSPAFYGEGAHSAEGRRVLLAPAPSDQHTFGLSMVVEFFRRAGWDVACDPCGTSDELVRVVRNEWFGVVGLSVSCAVPLESLALMIRALRRASRNRTIGVMVGGPMFLEHPDLVARVGADATAIDGQQAPIQAQRLVQLLTKREVMPRTSYA